MLAANFGCGFFSDAEKQFKVKNWELTTKNESRQFPKTWNYSTPNKERQLDLVFFSSNFITFSCPPFRFGKMLHQKHTKRLPLNQNFEFLLLVNVSIQKGMYHIPHIAYSKKRKWLLCASRRKRT